MGHWKDFEIRIRNGGDDAVAAVAELWETREKILFGMTDAFTKARWISVAERLPDDIPHGYCLVTDGTDVGTANYSKEGRQFYHCIDRDYWKPTHWMPLPEPPDTRDRLREQWERMHRDNGTGHRASDAGKG